MGKPPEKLDAQRQLICASSVSSATFDSMSFRVFIGRAGSAAVATSPWRRGSFIRMPLKAKILDGRVVSSVRSMSSKKRGRPAFVNTSIDSEPYDPPADVVFNSLYGLRTIELNRPDKLNALDASMIRKIIPRLAEWEQSGLANVVVIKGAGDKAFCAGGDVMTLAQMDKTTEEGWRAAREYFGLEYKLNHYIATYWKPYIAFMDGYTLGGGVGLSIHAPLRIATERTIFGMPETTIGFFPDVGASFFLPRLPGAVGTYLALTSEMVRGANVFYTGIATHYLHSSSLPDLESRLAELRFKDNDSMEKRLKIIEMTIEEYATGLPPLDKEPMIIAGEVRKAIDRCFSEPDIPSIVKALKEERGALATREWADKTLATLHQRSPTSVLVTKRQMNLGRSWSITETFEKEYQIAAHFMRHPDFNEGVQAQLGKPRRPANWQPAGLKNDNFSYHTITDPFFQPHPELEQLEMLAKNRDFHDYPHSHVGVPTETDVRKLVETGLDESGIADKLEQEKKGRQGIRLIVEEIIERKTEEYRAQLNWVKPKDEIWDKHKEEINELRQQREDDLTDEELRLQVAAHNEGPDDYAFRWDPNLEEVGDGETVSSEEEKD